MATPREEFATNADVSTTRKSTFDRFYDRFNEAENLFLGLMGLKGLPLASSPTTTATSLTRGRITSSQRKPSITSNGRQAYLGL